MVMFVHCNAINVIYKIKNILKVQELVSQKILRLKEVRGQHAFKTFGHKLKCI